MQGESFVPLLDEPAQDGKQVALSQYPRQGGLVMGYSMHTGRYRYIRWQDALGSIVVRELYDHSEAAVAHRNLTNQPAYADTLKKLDALVGTIAGISPYSDAVNTP